MGELPVRKLLLALILALWTSTPVIAAQNTSMPGLERPLAGGFVFPSLYTAVEANPAALLHDKKTVIEMDWEAPWRNAPTGALTQGFAVGGANFGFGGLLAASLSGNTLTLSRATLGAALGMPGSALGLNTSFDLATGTGVDLDLALTVENLTGVQLSLLLTSIQAFRTVGALNIGLGFAKPRQFQIEFSWSYTLFSPSQQHILAANGLVYIGILGLGVNLAYTTSAASSSTSLGPALSLSVSPKVVFSGRTFFDSALGPRFILGANLAF